MLRRQGWIGRQQCPIDLDVQLWIEHYRTGRRGIGEIGSAHCQWGGQVVRKPRCVHNHHVGEDRILGIIRQGKQWIRIIHVDDAADRKCYGSSDTVKGNLEVVADLQLLDDSHGFAHHDAAGCKPAGTDLEHVKGSEVARLQCKHAANWRRLCPAYFDCTGKVGRHHGFDAKYTALLGDSSHSFDRIKVGLYCMRNDVQLYRR